ncbi:MAG: cysteine-rich CWC family protein [Betaproteobacteria bacterium]
MIPTPASVCPLCAQPNQCAMEQGDAAPCWCTTVVFTPELLQRIPAAAQGLACVCQACAAQAKPG